MKNSRSSRLRIIAGAILFISAVLFLVIADWRGTSNESGNGDPMSPRDIPLTPANRNDIPTHSKRDASPFLFTNVVADSGVIFEYYGGPSADAHMTEQNGGGVALFDFDHDGTLDLFLVNGSRFNGSSRNAGGNCSIEKAR